MGPAAHFSSGWIDRPWWDGFGWLMPLVVLATFAVVAVWAISRITRQQTLPLAQAVASPPYRPRADGAVDEARLRHARGDLTREEYLQIARDLGAPATSEGGGTDG